MGKRHRIVLVSALTTCAAAVGAGMSDSRERSTLGEPLDFAVTVWGDDATQDVSECLNARVLDGASEVPAGDVVTELSSGRGAAHRTLTIKTRHELHEPTGSILLSMGCHSTMVRRFTVLADAPRATSLAAASQPAGQHPWEILPIYLASNVAAFSPVVPAAHETAPNSTRRHPKAAEQGARRTRHKDEAMASAAGHSSSKVARAKRGAQAVAVATAQTQRAETDGRSWPRLVLDTRDTFTEADIGPAAQLLAPARPMPSAVTLSAAAALPPTSASVAPRPLDATAHVAIQPEVALTPQQADRLRWLEYHDHAMEGEKVALETTVLQLRKELNARAAKAPVEGHVIGKGWLLAAVGLTLVVGFSTIVLIRRLQKHFGEEARGAAMSYAFATAPTTPAPRHTVVVPITRHGATPAGAIVRRLR